jgi:hypothetical protein
LPLPIAVIELYWETWIKWLALGKRFLPRKGGFDDQPELAMQVILFLDGLLEKISNAEINDSGEEE